MPQGLSIAKPVLTQAIAQAFMNATRAGSEVNADPDSIAITLGEEIGNAIDGFIKEAKIDWTTGFGNTGAPLGPNPAKETDPNLA